MKNSLFLSLPNKLSSCFGPKCLFILVNAIVVFLVGESRLVGSQSSPVGEIYDEYVERSRSLRGVSPHQDEEDKQETDQDRQTHIQVKEVVVKEQGTKEVTELTNEGGKHGHEEFEVEGDQHGEKEILEEEEEEEEESGLPPEELNRRVEEFIARINKQRSLEAQFLVCCET
ncbi:MYELIN TRANSCRIPTION FACTOR 1-LIKE [Salix viminalis]|uniref:MYELIN TRANSCRIPTION FACTOR 1-LIKE n=1 Tax=Salix viminalis TaxID=40686 RepID=A0A9Q0YXN8_SALVM|nr:MYELIN TRANSCRIPTION FACTOR 1-LIKE [Salix viminalis]